MNATIEQISKDVAGTSQNVYPVTLTQAVYTNDGESLDDVLEGVAQQSTLEEVQDSIGDPITGQPQTLFANFGELQQILEAINGDTIDGILSYYTDGYADQLRDIIGEVNE